MKLKHITPCRECPWRKTSLRGWLGNNPPELYADLVQSNTASNCHLHKEPTFCAGSLAVLNNSCTAARYPENAAKAADLVGIRADCFKWPGDFYSHHADGKRYVHPIERALALMGKVERK